MGLHGDVLPCIHFPPWSNSTPHCNSSDVHARPPTRLRASMTITLWPVPPSPSLELEESSKPNNFRAAPMPAAPAPRIKTSHSSCCCCIILFCFLVPSLRRLPGRSLALPLEKYDSCCAVFETPPHLSYPISSPSTWNVAVSRYRLKLESIRSDPPASWENDALLICPSHASSGNIII